ncbi:MAG: hypothetical protein SNH94_02550 [Rikenellaceae bacterium]
MKGRRSLAGVLLLIISAYYVNSTMFYHDHIVGGVKVTHSHFFSKFHTDFSSNGGHDLEAVKLIASLSEIALEEQNFEFHVEPTVSIVEAATHTYSTLKAVAPFVESRSLRAPPRA